MPQRTFDMFTDGSFNSDSKVYGGAYFVKGLLEGTVRGDDPELSSARNVAGECLAVIRGLKALIDQERLNSGDQVTIHHDYTGLAEWAEGRWQTKKAVSIRYLAAIQLFRQKGLRIKFHKVPAHAGLRENEYVDRLAKKAVGLK